MLNIYLNKNNIVFAILLTLVLAIVLINIKTYKEGWIFGTLKIKDSCLPKKKVSRPRPKYEIRPKCIDIIIPTKNTPEQKTFITRITEDIVIPEDDIDMLIPDELVKHKEEIMEIVKLLVVNETYDGELKTDLEPLIANTLFNIDNKELLENAPKIKILLQSNSLYSLIKPLSGTDKQKLIKKITNNKDVIEEATIPLTTEEDKKIRTTFNTYSQRCGVSLI